MNAGRSQGGSDGNDGSETSYGGGAGAAPLGGAARGCHSGSRVLSRTAPLLCQRLLLMVCCAVLAGTSARGAVIHVPADQPTIQAAIVAASNGDEIEVAPGTYNEAINFLGKAINLHSSGGAAVTILDGTGLTSSIITCWSG